MLGKLFVVVVVVVVFFLPFFFLPLPSLAMTVSL